jgi:hypothetical protein
LSVQVAQAELQYLDLPVVVAVGKFVKLICH